MNDNLLVKQMQEDNADAYKQMFIKYYSPLCEYTSQYVTDEDAEELVQDLMLFIWENRKKLIITQSLKSYLFIAAKHRCLNAIQKNIYHERVHSLLYEKLKEQFDDPDFYFINELTENINKAISELPETYRETFHLSRFDELTNQQIALSLGVSIKTVEYRISQSLKILRLKLKDYLPLLSFLFGFPS
ncbi:MULTISPECIES: RNA polymerase sigma-70 factor [Parabacteroides]|uniref:RNA polymerase sigma-70 factor n=1 Tax=Parabacteroides leei TaxID=2939491 RepID=UPI00189851AD|nr:RNA polymerase sigma-70 factor [Parabacteroides goldsteinii]